MHSSFWQAAFLLLREWTDMPPENEFRAFLRGGAVTAISQYATQATLPALQDPVARHRVVSAMVAFIGREVLPRLPAEPYRAACVVDLSWTAAGLARSAAAVDAVLWPPCGLCVVELNPFCRRTGAGLYSWRADWAALVGRIGGGVAFRFRSAASEAAVDDTYAPEPVA